MDCWKIAAFIGTIIFLVSAFLPLISVTVLDTTASISLIDLYSALAQAGEQTGDVTVKLKCDLNSDGVVNVLDVTIISKAYNSRPGDPKWNPDFDFDKDGRLSILDVLAVCKEYSARA